MECPCHLGLVYPSNEWPLSYRPQRVPIIREVTVGTVKEQGNPNSLPGPCLGRQASVMWLSEAVRDPVEEHSGPHPYVSHVNRKLTEIGKWRLSLDPKSREPRCFQSFSKIISVAMGSFSNSSFVESMVGGPPQSAACDSPISFLQNQPLTFYRRWEFLLPTGLIVPPPGMPILRVS